MYEDDANQDTGELFEELSLDTQQDTQETNIPDKYKNKSVDELIKMHQEAEKVISRQGNEVAEVRSLADQLIKQQLPKQEISEPQSNIDEVDFFADPVTTVNKVIEKHPLIQKVTQETIAARRIENKRALLDAHPDQAQIVAEQEFKDFIMASPIRQQLFVKADREFDFESANELLSTYKEIKKAKQQMNTDAATAVASANEKRLKDGKVDAGGTGASGKKIFNRAALMRLMATDRDKYDAMSDEILQAYREGRVR